MKITGLLILIARGMESKKEKDKSNIDFPDDSI